MITIFFVKKFLQTNFRKMVFFVTKHVEDNVSTHFLNLVFCAIAKLPLPEVKQSSG